YGCTCTARRCGRGARSVMSRRTATTSPPSGNVRSTPRPGSREPHPRTDKVRPMSGARVGIVMGSDSDWPTMEPAAEALEEFGVAYEADVVSAHRMPDAMLDYGHRAHERGLQVL